jgi:hypothetical protein
MNDEKGTRYLSKYRRDGILIQICEDLRGNATSTSMVRDTLRQYESPKHV